MVGRSVRLPGLSARPEFGILVWRAPYEMVLARGICRARGHSR